MTVGHRFKGRCIDHGGVLQQNFSWYTNLSMWFESMTIPYIWLLSTWNGTKIIRTLLICAMYRCSITGKECHHWWGDKISKQNKNFTINVYRSQFCRALDIKNLKQYEGSKRRGETLILVCSGGSKIMVVGTLADNGIPDTGNYKQTKGFGELRPPQAVVVEI